jgi:hypothetical protein
MISYVFVWSPDILSFVLGAVVMLCALMAASVKMKRGK